MAQQITKLNNNIIKMDYTTLAAKMLDNLETRMAPIAYSKITAELAKEYNAGRTFDLINAGDIYRAGDAIGIDVRLFEGTN